MQFTIASASKATKHVTHYGSSGWTNAAFMNHGKTHNIEALKLWKLLVSSIGNSCPTCIYETRSIFVFINITNNKRFDHKMLIKEH